ncbi:MAG: hypothetical protein ABIF88_02590 [archaeon]
MVNKSNIRGTATGVGFGRGGISEGIKFVEANPEIRTNISGVATAVGFGRGGIFEETKFVEAMNPLKA